MKEHRDAAQGEERSDVLGEGTLLEESSLAEDGLERLQERLGYRFQDRRKLERALTHPSYANERRTKRKHNQRMEFLGDAVIGMLIASYLYEQEEFEDNCTLSTTLRRRRVDCRSRYELSEWHDHRRFDHDAFVQLTDRCAAYCRYCTRSRMVSNAQDYNFHPEFEQGLSYIEGHPEVRDVLLSGGDPLLLSDRKIEYLLKRLRAIPHVEFIRIGSRIPVFPPQLRYNVHVSQ